tara:strand:+ start:131 stop:358 length:228 start_codon:yes stop_codon:yes gene_type:complete
MVDKKQKKMGDIEFITQTGYTKILKPTGIRAGIFGNTTVKDAGLYAIRKNKQRIDKLNKEMKTGSFTYDGKFRYK